MSECRVRDKFGFHCGEDSDHGFPNYDTV